MEAELLSYHEMTMDLSGSIMSHEAKAQFRKQQGFCMTCPGVPILLVDIHRSRMNPLWWSKKPRTVEGECVNGKCLRCHPSLAPVTPNNKRSTSTASLSSQSQGSQASQSLGSKPSVHEPMTSYNSRRSWNSLERGSAHSLSTDSLLRSDSELVVCTEMTTVSSLDISTMSIHEEPNDYEQSEGSMTNLNPIRHRTAVRSVSADGLPPFDASPRRRVSARTHQMRRSVPSRSRSEVVGRSPLSSSTFSSPTARAGLSGEERVVSSAMDRTETSRGSIELATASGDEAASHIASIADFGNHSFFICDEESEVTGQAHKESVGTNDLVDDGTQAVDELKALVQDLKNGDECLGILTEILLSSMDLHRSKEKVQVFCLDTMSVILKDAVTDVLVEKILQAMNDFRPSLAVQKSACKAVSVLADNPNDSLVLVRNGACKIVTQAVGQHIGDANFVSGAVAALRKLSVSWEGRDALQRAGTSEHVAQAMQCNTGSVHVQLDGCALLSNIAVDPEKRRVSRVSVDVLQAIVGALVALQDETQVAVAACFALKNFTYEKSNLRALNRIQGVSDVLTRLLNLGSCGDATVLIERMQLAKAEDESVEEQAAESLFVMVELQSKQSSLIRDIVDMMKSFAWSSKVTAACLRSLTKLSRSSELHSESLRNGTLLTDVMQLVDAHSSDPQVEHDLRILIDSLTDEPKIKSLAQVAEIMVSRDAESISAD